MSRDKNKNSYGTFLAKKGSFSKMKKTAALGILAVVLILGVGTLVFKQFHKTKPAQVAETKITNEIPGWWFQQYFVSAVCDKEICKPESDPDNDKLTNAQEFYYHTDPTNAHTVKDKLSDGELVAQGFDPSKPGKVKFDEVVSEDNVIGESMVFNQDAVKIFSEVIDLNNAKIPTVNTLELKVSNTNSKDSINAYLTKLNQTVLQYFPQSIIDSITTSVQSQDQARLDDLKIRSAKLLIALKSIEVPSDALTLHKEYIGMYQLLPSVVNIPAKQDIQDQTSQVGNFWFEQTQGFMYLMQQTGIEASKLQNKYK